MINELMSSCIVATIVTILVWYHVPTIDTKESKRKTISLIVKSFVISFGLSYAIFYFIGETGSEEVLDNVIKGDPDF